MPSATESGGTSCAVLMSNSPERTIRTPLDRHRLIDSDMVTLRRRAQTVYARQPTAQMPCARDDGVTPNLKSLINVQSGHGIDDNRTLPFGCAGGRLFLQKFHKSPKFAGSLLLSSPVPPNIQCLPLASTHVAAPVRALGILVEEGTPNEP